MEEECPYCGHTEQYQGDPLAEDERTESECRECGKTYTIIQCCSFWLNSEKLPDAPEEGK